MTTAFASANLLTLVISWLAESAFTYTLQTSTDLLNWSSLPFVMTGSGGWESFTVDKEGRETFARLRYSADGDTNENGLPDRWEWAQFGYLDVDPLEDADGDGQTNYAEWLDATDPLDFYDGATPVIHLACGSSWLVPAGTVSQQQLYVSLFHANGDPWIHAPVTIAMESGQERLLAGVEASPAASVLVRWTDANGQIRPDTEAVSVIAPSTAGARDTIRVNAGRGRAAVLVQSVGTGLGPPPRQLLRSIEATGESRLSWSGPPEGASHFLLQERQPDGTWADAARVPVEDLPPPDPETGRYIFILEPSAG